MDKWIQVAAQLLKNAYFWTPGHARRTEQAIATALSAVFEAGRQEEREACARVVENHPRSIPINDDDAAALGILAREAGPRDYAAAIRNREVKS